MKKQEKTELTKEKILQAAMQEFGTNGYAGTGINIICSRHEISKGLLYHNFTGKDDLYLICVEKCFSEITAYLQEGLKQVNLQQYLELRFRYFTENPLCARVFFEALLQPPKELSDRIKEIKREFEQFNRRVYRTALSEMTLRPGVTGEEALEYYEVMQDMFNCYFSSPAYSGRSMQSVITEHESRLGKMLDFMLYGIAERSE